jgi:uncharacterized repeat protein (TIGR03803 family)
MKKLYSATITLLILCTTCYAQNHHLWATARYGGTNGRGGIFVADSAGNNFHSVYNCDARGSEPTGNVVMADNGLLYGTTMTGGYHDSCVIYTYDEPTGTFTSIYEFLLQPDSGYTSHDGLMIGADRNLYGFAQSDGSGNGVIYCVHTSDNSYHVLHSFDTVEGSQPCGIPLQLSDGKLYGVTNSGGMNGNTGTIFSFDLSNSHLAVLHQFVGNAGHSPASNLIQAVNGKLYGMTSIGGSYNCGVIFSLDLIGNVYTDLYHFDGTLGRFPHGSLIQAANGKFYGMTLMGGINDIGVLFSFDPLTNTYIKLLDFNETNGAWPEGTLTKAANGKLYGVTSGGGASSAGVIFTYDVTSNSLTKVYEFDGVSGSSPSCNIYESGAPISVGVTSLHDKDEFKLTPNPCVGSFEISIDESMIGSTATISDITGRKMAAVQLLLINNQLSIAGFAGGVYFVTVSASDGRSVTKKLVIQK